MTVKLPYSPSEQYRTKFPDFLLKKMDNFYFNRLRKEWNGEHIFRRAAFKEHSIDLTSNDYLQLFTDAKILASNNKITEGMPAAPLMSASFMYENTPQTTLENRLASFFESESAILCQSGYVANVGLMQALVEDTDIPVYIDMMTHMSVWNGIRLGGGKAVPFLHNDMNSLLKKINEFGSGIIVVDSVYSTDGTIAPLLELAEVAKAKECMLIIDESHSVGTHGPEGKGLAVELGINDVVLFRTTSLAKAFASRAGLILCPQEFKEFFNMTSKPQIFSSALMPFDIDSLNTILNLIQSETGNYRRTKLHRNSKQLKNLLLSFDIDISESESQIIALKTNSENKLISIKKALESEHIFGAPFCSPATSKKRPVLRLTLHSELQADQLEHIAISCKKVYSNL